MSIEARHLTVGILLMFVVMPLFGYFMLFEVIPAVHVWERDAGYPLGKLCELYNTCSH
jgi:hypothetical protein